MEERGRSGQHGSQRPGEGGQPEESPPRKGFPARGGGGPERSNPDVLPPVPLIAVGAPIPPASSGLQESLMHREG